MRRQNYKKNVSLYQLDLWTQTAAYAVQGDYRGKKIMNITETTNYDAQVRPYAESKSNLLFVLRFNEALQIRQSTSLSDVLIKCKDCSWRFSGNDVATDDS